MAGLGIGGMINLAMMAYQMYNKNQEIKSTKSMQEIDMDIDGGKEGDNDEVVEDGKAPSTTDFLATADSKTTKKPSGLGTTSTFF